MLIETKEPLVGITSVLLSHKFWDETWVARLHSKHLYLLSHLQVHPSENLEVQTGTWPPFCAYDN